MKNLITLCNKMWRTSVCSIFSIIFLCILVTNAQYDNYGGGYDDPQNSGSVPIGEFFFFLELIHYKMALWWVAVRAIYF